MRRILLVIIGLACAIPVAEAASRDGRQGQAASRTAQQQSHRQQVPQRRATLRPGDVRTQRDGIAVRGAVAARVPRNTMAARAPRNAMASNCTRRNGRTNCAPARSSIAGWQSGLPVANYAQQECPNGTMATLARGHDDVVRCMPL